MIASHSSHCSSSHSISESRSTRSVISGNTMSISALRVLDISCQKRSCERYHTRSPDARSIVPLYSPSRPMIILRRVVLPAPFLPMSATLSRRVICISASTKSSVCSICFASPVIEMSAQAIRASHAKRYSGIDSRL